MSAVFNANINWNTGTGNTQTGSTSIPVDAVLTISQSIPASSSGNALAIPALTLSKIKGFAISCDSNASTALTFTITGSSNTTLTVDSTGFLWYNGNGMTNPIANNITASCVVANTNTSAVVVNIQIGYNH